MKRTYTKLILCMISISMLMPSTVGIVLANEETVIPLSQQILALFEDQRGELNEIAHENGFSDILQMVQSFNERSITYADQSRIKDLNDSGAVNVSDAIALASFLKGNYLYAYSYSELDVTNDYILDINDVNAYLEYLSHYPSSAFSAHGSQQTIDYTYERRSYTKYDYQTSSTSTYTLQQATMLSNVSPLNLPATPVSALPQGIDGNTDDLTNNEGNDTDLINLPHAYDNRIVQIGQILPGQSFSKIATGFIVDHHVIATAGHCVYNRGTGQFNPYRAVRAITYTQSQNGSYVPHYHYLTIDYAATPTNYITCSDANTK